MLNKIESRLQEIDKQNLSEKQEAQLETCLKKLEQLRSEVAAHPESEQLPDSTVEKAQNLGNKVEALWATTQNESTTNDEEKGPQSQNGGEKTSVNDWSNGSPTPPTEAQAADGPSEDNSQTDAPQ